MPKRVEEVENVEGVEEIAAERARHLGGIGRRTSLGRSPYPRPLSRGERGENVTTSDSASSLRPLRLFDPFDFRQEVSMPLNVAQKLLRSHLVEGRLET